MGIIRKFTVSAPCKVHLLGEWAVVWGKPALLTSVDLRVYAKVSTPKKGETVEDELVKKIQKVIDPIIKRRLKLKKIPPYFVSLKSDVPIGAGLGSSAAISAAYIGALLSYLRVGWNLNLINDLAYEAEKVFHGNPSGADNSTVTCGKLIWFRKESPTLKLIDQVSFNIPQRLAKNFCIIHTGTPSLTTKQMITKITAFFDKKPKVMDRFLEDQEKLVRELLPAIKKSDQKEVIRIIKEGEKNLEIIGVSSKFAQDIIRKIESLGGAAKICGAGASDGPTGVLLCFHKNRKVVEGVAKSYNLPYFRVKLGVEGVRRES